MRAHWLAAATCLALVACHSAGPYGYSREYSPLDAETDAVDGAREYDPVMAQREPDDWKKGRVMLFGIVRSRSEGPGGAAYLAIGMRTLADRNLCDDFDEETCRVTVNTKEHAVVHALAKLDSSDNIGQNSLSAGSLVRVVGKISDAVDPDDGAPVIEVSYYRHWPRGYFVTSAEAAHLRK